MHLKWQSISIEFENLNVRIHLVEFFYNDYKKYNTVDKFETRKYSEDKYLLYASQEFMYTLERLYRFIVKNVRKSQLFYFVLMINDKVKFAV